MPPQTLTPSVPMIRFEFSNPFRKNGAGRCRHHHSMMQSKSTSKSIVQLAREMLVELSDIRQSHERIHRQYAHLRERLQADALRSPRSPKGSS